MKNPKQNQQKLAPPIALIRRTCVIVYVMNTVMKNVQQFVVTLSP